MKALPLLCNVTDALARQAEEADTLALAVQWTGMIFGSMAIVIGLIVLWNRSRTAGNGWMIRVACTFVVVFTGWYVAETAVNDWIRQYGIADESTIVSLQITVRLVTLIAGGLITRMALRKNDPTIEGR